MYLLYFYARTSIKRFNTLVRRNSAHGKTFKRVRFRFVISRNSKTWMEGSLCFFIHSSLFFCHYAWWNFSLLPLSLKSKKFFLLISQICNFIFLERELEPICSSELSRKRVLKCYNATGIFCELCHIRLSASHVILPFHLKSSAETSAVHKLNLYVAYSFTWCDLIWRLPLCIAWDHIKYKCCYRGWKNQLRLKHS